MTQNARVAAGERWADQISLGVLASSVPRDVIDDVVASHGRQAKRSDGKLPPHVMVYFAMAMALFAEGDYEEVGARLAGGLGSWGCWDARGGAPTSGGITRARGRLGFSPRPHIFPRGAVPGAVRRQRGGVRRARRVIPSSRGACGRPDPAAQAPGLGAPRA